MDKYIISRDRGTQEIICCVNIQYICSIRKKENEEGSIVRTVDGMDYTYSQSVEEIYEIINSKK